MNTSHLYRIQVLRLNYRVVVRSLTDPYLQKIGRGANFPNSLTFMEIGRNKSDGTKQVTTDNIFYLDLNC